MSEGTVGELAKVEDVFDIYLLADCFFDLGFACREDLSATASDGAEADKKPSLMTSKDFWF